jgi:hypothetical protein
MSWIDSIVDFGSKAVDWFKENPKGGAIVRSIGSAIVLNQVQKSINKENQTPSAAESNKPDLGVREQVDPDTDSSIPVVYGTAFTSGKVIDAQLTDSNTTMWYCLAICEKTGPLINGTASVITIDSVYWNENLVTFDTTDGVTVQSFTSEDGVVSTNPNGLIKMYFYNNGSSNQIGPGGYAITPSVAYGLMPEWTSNHTMDELVFCLVKVTYSRAAQVTGLGNIQFKVRNTMTQPGDVINDYLTNTRYGAGIAAEEINQ